MLRFLGFGLLVLSIGLPGCGDKEQGSADGDGAAANNGSNTPVAATPSPAGHDATADGTPPAGGPTGHGHAAETPTDPNAGGADPGDGTQPGGPGPGGAVQDPNLLMYVHETRIDGSTLRSSYYIQKPFEADKVFWIVERVTPRGIGRSRKFEFEITADVLARMEAGTQSNEVALNLALPQIQKLGTPPYAMYIEVQKGATRKLVSNIGRTDVKSAPPPGHGGGFPQVAVDPGNVAPVNGGPGPTPAGATPAAPTAEPGTPEYVVQSVIIKLAAGEREGLEELIADDAKGTLGKLRDGSLEDGERQRVRETVARVRFVSARVLSGGTRMFVLENDAQQMIRVTLRRRAGEYVVVGIDLGD